METLEVHSIAHPVAWTGGRRVEHRPTRETILGCHTLSSLVFERVGPSAVQFFTNELGKAASSRRTPKRTKRLTRLSFGLIRHYCARLHYPAHIVDSYVDVRQRIAFYRHQVAKITRRNGAKFLFFAQ